METFDCNLCKKKFDRQFEFFGHLKDHYEEKNMKAKESMLKDEGDVSSPALVDQKKSTDKLLDGNDSNVDINNCASQKNSTETSVDVTVTDEPSSSGTETNENKTESVKVLESESESVVKKSGRGRKRNVEVQQQTTTVIAETKTPAIAVLKTANAAESTETENGTANCKQEMVDDGNESTEVSTGEVTSMPRRSRRKPVKAAIRNIKREYLLTEDEFDFIDRDSGEDDDQKIKILQEETPNVSEVTADETFVETMDAEQIDNDDPDFDPITDVSAENIVYEEIEDSKVDSMSDMNDGDGTRKKRASKTKAPTVMENNKLFYKCNECDRKFGHRSSYDYHRRWHAGDKKFICQYCQKAFLSSTLLKVHTRIHTDERPFACKMCDKAFRQWSDLKYHFDSLHSNEKNYQCEFCGKGFARNYSLIIHRRIHTGEKNYKCEVCGKSFRASCYLLMHRMIHTGEKRYSCDICQKRFRLNSDMKRHRETHSANRKRGSKKKQITVVSADSIEQQLNTETEEMVVFEENEETIFKIERYVPGENSDDEEDQNTFVVTPLVVKVVNPN